MWYFRQKDQLIAALLHRVLATTALLGIPANAAHIPHEASSGHSARRGATGSLAPHLIAAAAESR